MKINMAIGLTTALIGAGAALAGTAGNMYANAKMNKRAEKYNRWMYSQSRADALADRDFALQYQSPQAQMQRLQAAGLNPNLMYGSGVQAQSAPDVRGSKMEAPKRVPVAMDIGGVAQSAIQGMQARANISLTEAQAEKVRTETAAGKFDLELKNRIGLERMANTASTKLESQDSQYKREWYEAEVHLSAMSSDKDGKPVPIDSKNSKYRAVIESGYTMALQQVKNAKTDGNIKEAIRAVKEFEANLAKNGIPPNSPWYVKALMELFENIGGSAARSLLIGQ